MKVVELEKTTNKHSDGTFLYKYKCYCGNLFLALKRNLTSGKQQSCGCFRKSGGTKHRTGKSPGNALHDWTASSFNSLYSSYVASARNKARIFDLNKDIFRELTSSRCHYCGRPPGTEHKNKWSRQYYVFNGIDRKNNAEGYTVENSISCCSSCNYLKKAHSYDAFVAMIKRIYNHLSSK